VNHRSERFGPLLVLIIATYAVVIAFGSTRAAGAIRLVMLALVLAAAIRIRGAGGRWITVSVAGGVVAIAAGAVALVHGSDRLSVTLVSAAVLLLVIAAILAILVQLWHRPVVDAHTVAGALSVYLLLALLFAALHQLFAALLGLPYLNGVSTVVDAAKYLYFSVITLSTVGYGDISPASNAARAVAMSEALVGQLYLVAVVGTVVGNLAGTRRQAADSPAGDEAGTRVRG